MHPIDTKILKYEYGTYSDFPHHLTAPIISIQESTIDLVFRNNNFYRILESAVNTSNTFRFHVICPFANLI